MEVARCCRACARLARRVLCLVSPNRRINGDTHMRKTQLATAVCLGVGLSIAFSMSAQAQDAYANGDGSAAANNHGTASSSIASSYNTTNTSSFNTTDVVAEGVLNGSVSGVSVSGIGNVANNMGNANGGHGGAAACRKTRTVQSWDANRVACRMARLASSSAATSAPPITCTVIPRAINLSANVRLDSCPAQMTTLSMASVCG